MGLEQPDDKQIELYLVGALSEAESERLDELSVTDDAFADRLRAVENDLVDACARGELSGKIGESFKSNYLSSPRRREKVQFAEALATLRMGAGAIGTEREAAAGPDSGPGKRLQTQPARKSGWRQRRAGPWPVWAFAMPAMALLLVAVGYLAVENWRLDVRITRATQERSALEQRETDLKRQIEEGESESIRTAEELARVRERLAQIEQQAAEGQPWKQDLADHRLPVVSLVLAPPTRGTSPIPVLTVPSGNAFAALELGLESDDFSVYDAKLKDAATNRVLWHKANLKAIPRGQTRAIAVKLGAGLLRPGIYNIDLVGTRAGGAPEIVGTYPFRVVIQ